MMRKRCQLGMMCVTQFPFARVRTSKLPMPIACVKAQIGYPRTIHILSSYQRAMMKMTRAQLREAIQNRGENPPTEWSNVELRDRLSELMELAGENTGNPKKTDLRQWISELNRTSKKKELLKSFCEERLKLTLQGNETIPMLQKRATKAIYEVSIANALDPVGFGKWSSMSYGQVRREQPQYARWVQETLLEGGNSCDYRLVRLGTWLMSQPDDEAEEELIKDHPTALSPARAAPKALAPSTAKGIKAGKGYAGEKSVSPKMEAATRDVPAASSSSMDGRSTQADQMKLMMETMLALKEEIKELRNNQKTEEPRRKKKDESEDTNTEKSFAVVMDP